MFDCVLFQMNDDWDLPIRVRLEVSAASPVIILPVSSQHREVLIIDLGNLSVTNMFKWSDSSDKYSDETHSKQIPTIFIYYYVILKLNIIYFTRVFY